MPVCAKYRADDSVLGKAWMSPRRPATKPGHGIGDLSSGRGHRSEPETFTFPNLISAKGTSRSSCKPSISQSFTLEFPQRWRDEILHASGQMPFGAMQPQTPVVNPVIVVARIP